MSASHPCHSSRPAPGRPRARARRGFTLVELATVLVIMGILATIGAPSLVSAYNQRAVASAGDEFAATAGLARATAQRFGRTAQLHVDLTAGRFFVDVDTSGAGQRAQVGLRHDLGARGIVIARGDTLVCFDARGGLTAPGACHAGVLTFVFRRTSAAATGDSAVLPFTTYGKILR